MRNFRFLGLCLACLFMLCSCGSQPAAQTTVPTPDDAGNAASASVPVESITPSASMLFESLPVESLVPGANAALTDAFSLNDLALEADGQTHKIRDNAAPLLAALGDDYEYSEAVSCVFDGYDKVYAYPAIEVCTIPDGENDLIDQLLLLDDTYQTLRGIKVGDGKAEVEAAYGDGYFMDGPYMTYTVSGDAADISSPRCHFELDDSDTVIQISLYYPPEEI